MLPAGVPDALAEGVEAVSLLAHSARWVRAPAPASHAAPGGQPGSWPALLGLGEERGWPTPAAAAGALPFGLPSAPAGALLALAAVGALLGLAALAGHLARRLEAAAQDAGQRPARKGGAAPPPSGGDQSAPGGQAVAPLQTLRCVCAVARPFFAERASRAKAWALFAATLVSAIAIPKLQIWYAHLFEGITNALVARDPLALRTSLWSYATYVAVLVLVNVFDKLSKGAFALEWRQHLSRSLLSRYFAGGRAFYTLKLHEGTVDNPDQRITQDVDGFTDASVSLLSYVTAAAATVVLSSIALFQTSPSLFATMVGYAVIYNLAMLVIFGTPLVRLQSRVLEQEASLRFGLTHVRENAEAVALYGGAASERSRCGRLLAQVIGTRYCQLGLSSMSFGMDTGGGSFVGLFPYVVLAPAIFVGEMEFGTAAAAQMLCMQLVGAMIALVGQMDSLSTLAAHATRVRQLEEALAAGVQAPDCAGSDAGVPAECAASRAAGGSAPEATAPVQPEVGEVGLRTLPPASEERLCLRDVWLVPPSAGCGVVPARVSLALKRGQSLLVSGESGVGKTSLLRAIAGLWTRGGGVISRCCERRTFMVPQQPYLCLGSLWDNAVYPGPSGDAEPPGDDEVVQTLERVNLGHLVVRHGLRAAANLELLLSVGERQRLGFARALLRRDLDLLLLDEATSALDGASEERMYSAVREHVECYVSVGHRAALEAFHTHKVSLQRMPDGGVSATFGRMREQHCGASDG